MDSRKMPGWAIPLAVALAVVALVVVGLSRKPVELGTETPEGTVQAYLNAIARSDFDTASTYWDEQGCVPSTTDPGGFDPGFSATLVSVETTVGQATVVVGISQGTTDAVGGYTEYQEWFSLVPGDNGWKIRQPSWPFYDVTCEDQA